jgi:signal transduction histidine kinase
MGTLRTARVEPMRIFRWLDRFTPRRYRKGDPNNFRRARFIISLALLGLIGALGLGLVFSYLMPFQSGVAVSLLGALIYTTIPMILEHTSLEIAGHFLVLTFFALTGCITYSVGGWSAPLLIWYAFLPAMSALVTKARWAYVWSFLVTVQLLGLYWLHLNGYDRPRLRDAEVETLSLLSIFAFLSALLILTFLYEKFEGQIIRRLQRNNRELALARDQALEASHAKSSFLANMSHEFRTPLNAIIGYSDMMLEEETLSPSVQGDLVRIRQAGAHLLKLVNGLLDLSKIEAGKMDLDIHAIPLQRLLEEVEDTVRPLIQQQNNTFEVKLPDTPVTLQTDVLKLKQCLINLLGNAAKFTTEGQVQLVAALDATGQRINFEVRDNGIGMSNEQMRMIFIPFTQADASTTRKYGGTGLGLTLARRLAELLGGDIRVASEPGKGSIFTLSTPLKIHPFT